MSKKIRQNHNHHHDSREKVITPSSLPTYLSDTSAKPTPKLKATSSLSSLPPNWPSDIKYLTKPSHASHLSPVQLDYLHCDPQNLPYSSSDSLATSSLVLAPTSPTTTSVPLPPPPSLFSLRPALQSNISASVGDGIPRVPLSQSILQTRSKTEIRSITSSAHPACGQRGLFAARHLPPDDLIVVYLGFVHGNETGFDSLPKSQDDEQEHDCHPCDGGNGEKDHYDNDETVARATAVVPGAEVVKSTTKETPERQEESDYDIALDRELDIAIDAASCGNEGRFVNDYRGVHGPAFHGEYDYRDGDKGLKGWNGTRKGKAGPNAEFRDIWMIFDEESHGRDQDQLDEVDVENDDQEGDSMGRKTNEEGRNGKQGDKNTEECLESRKRVNKARGERGIGIFVLGAGKSGKRKGGIKQGEEILVSYGKGFWDSRRNDVNG